MATQTEIKVPNGESNETSNKTTEMEKPWSLQEDGNGKVNLLAALTSDGKSVKQVFVLKLVKSDVESKSLAHLRDIMTASSDKKEFAGLHFCTKDGAVVDDDWVIKDHLADVKDKDDGGRHRVYLKRKYRAAEDIEKIDVPSVDLTLPGDAKFLDAPAAEKLVSAIKKADWAAAKATKIDAPADLNEGDWAVVVENNNLCYGLSIIRKKDGDKTIPIGITRARFPAFHIKEQRLRQSKLSAVEARNKDLKYRIPDFIIDDRSYVSIYETQTQFQSSLANSSFSEWDVSASGGGSVFGASIGVSAGYASKNSNQSAVGQSRSSSLMNISYNFPRVQLILDQYSLELTEDCKEQLKQVRNEEDMTKFLDLYGEFFSTRVQLGGRLYASEAYDSKNSSSAEATLKSMKAQAAASFKTAHAKGSAKGGYGSSEGSEQEQSNSEMHSTLQWQANGGDTLLCNNPPQWCPTVAPFTNWRITKRDGNCHIIDLIARYQDQARLKQFVSEQDFKFLDNQQSEPTGPEKPLEPPKFYLRAEQSAGQWKYLRIGETVSQIGPVPISHGSYISTLGVMRDWAFDSNISGKYFVLEDEEGNPVYEPCYGVPYFMKSPSSGYYLTVQNETVNSERARPSKQTCLVLRGSAGRESGAIQNNDNLAIRIRNLDSPTQGDQLLGFENAGEFTAIKTGISGAEAVFNYRLKSFSDATFGKEED